VRFFGDNQAALHLAMFPFFAACVIMMYFIARLVVPGKEMGCAVLFAVTPSIMVNSLQIMTDIPLAAFMMASLFFMMRSIRSSDDLFAGLFAGLACLVKMPAITILAAACAAYVPSRQWRKLVLFAIPFSAVNGLWFLHNAAVFGKMQFLFTGRLGYLYYMHKAGYTDCAVSPQEPRPGDFVIHNTFHCADSELRRDMTTLEKVREFHYPMFPLATMGDRSGFYDNDRLPCWYIWGYEYVYHLYRVIK
jgi:4-amino-4-deoxy-L-arabinose transferase-like glycosyltransferase